MTNDEGRLSFGFELNDADLKKQIANSQRAFEQLASNVEADGARMDGAISNVVDRLKQLGMAWSVKEFSQKVMQVRGQFQQLEMSFKTMLQSEEKANALMQQLVKTAAITPFDLAGVANGAKQLLAYGLEADKVNSTLIRLGDIAAGLSIPLGDIVYLYGTTMAQGRLYTQDLNQFTGRGIPMIQELAKQFGVADSEVKKLVEEGKVGFPEVQKVIENLTDKGGKFGGLMEAQSKTITGQIANIEDAIDMMFNDIGQSQEGIINMGLDLAGKIVENWQKVGEAIAVAVTAYGSYKAVLMAVTAYQTIEARLLGQIAVEKSLAAAAGIQLSNAEAMAAAKTKLLTIAQNGLAAALKRVAAATIANPYVLAAAAITALVYAIYKCVTADSALEAAQKSLTRALDKTAEAQRKYNEETEKAIDTAKDDAAATADRDEALQTLIRRYPSIIQKYIDEKGQLRDILALKKEIAEYDGKKQRQETADTLKKESEDAGNMLLTAERLRRKQLSGRTFSSSEKTEADALRKKYAADTDTSLWKVSMFTSLKDIEDFYRSKKDTSQKQYRRKLTENKITDFTAEGGALGGMDDAALKSFRANLRASQSESKKKSAVFIREVGDYLNYNDRQDLLTRVDAMIKARNEPKKEDTDKDKNSKNGGKSGDDEAKKRLEAQEALNEQLKQLQQKNADDEITLMQDSTEKKLAEIRNDYRKQLSEIDKQEAEFKKKNKEAGKGGNLTGEQSDALNEARMLAKQEYDKQIEDTEKEALKSQLEAMRDYLKNYGTYQQQKLAIAEEYAQKIKEVNESSDNEATKAWKVKSLEAERNKAVQQTEIAAIKQRIDWGSVFGEFGAMFKEQLQPTIDSLKSIAQSKEFKSSSLEEQKTLYELINKLEQSNTVWDSNIFQKVSDDIMAYQSAMNNLVAAQEQERKATVALAEAKERLKKAEAEGNEVGTDIAKAEVARAEESLSQASESVKLFGSQVEQTSADLQTSSQQAVNQLQQLESGLSGLTSGSLKGLASALTSLDKLFGKGELEKGLAATLANSFQSLLGENSKASKAISEALGNAGMAGAIISAVLGILDMIAQNGISGIITSLQDTMFGAVEGLLDDVLSGDIIMKPLENAAKHWYNIGNILTFGAFDSIFDGNGSEVESEINSLTRSNESLEDSINRLKDTMEKSIGTKAKEAYEEAMRQQQQVNDNKLKIAQRQASYWSAHNSWSSYWKGFTDDEKQEISKTIGKAFTGDVWDLSPEDMNKMLGYEWFTDKIRNTGYHYNGRSAYGESVLSTLRDYGDQAGKLEELTDSFYESVTQISFDSMKDNFISNLMDMSKSAEDFSDDFAEYMQKAMLTNAMADIIEGDMRQLYDDWAKALEENGGTLSEEQIEEFNRRYDALVEKGIEKRDGIAKITGYTGEDSSSEGQSATTIASAGLTEDTGKAIEGRFTAMQIATEGIGSSIAAIQPDIHAISLSALAVQTDMKALGTTATAIMQNTAEMRNISLTAVDHLESIAKNTRELYTMNERLDKIEKNTRKI